MYGAMHGLLSDWGKAETAPVVPIGASCCESTRRKQAGRNMLLA